MIATMFAAVWTLIKLDAPVWVWCLFIISAALEIMIDVLAGVIKRIEGKE